MNIITYRGNAYPSNPQSYVENYKRSAFCIEQPVEDGILLCHAMTGTLVHLTNVEYMQIRSREPLTYDWAEVLASLGFLPDASLDEYAQADHKREQERGRTSRKNAITSYTILPTSRCNARCFYCYEAGIPQKNMSPKTAEDVAAFIVRSSNGQNVRLSWFGGEPTIAHPIISQICQYLKTRNVAFYSSMISNGLLMDQQLIATAFECWNLRHIQITLDGTQTVYNVTKNYKGAIKNPFGIVISNIEQLLNANIRVSVRVNLGLHNYEDVSLLITQLSEQFPKKKGLSVYVHEIDNYYNEEIYSDLMNKTQELNELLIQWKLQEPPELPSLRLHSCMADNDQSVLINPDGQLGKCEHFVFEKLHGSIYSDDIDSNLIAQWRKPVRFAQCSTCPFYASCLRLEWCNGGSYFCRDGVIQSKLSQTRHAMLQYYGQWKNQRVQFRQTDTFRLTVPYEITELDGQLSVVFAPVAEHSDPVTLPVNQTSLDILETLSNPHTLKEIVHIMEEKYDTSGYAVADIVEEYLISILQEGVCEQRKVQKNDISI